MPGRKKVRGAGKAASKVRVFAHSMRDTSNAAYRDRAKVLRDKYGITFGFPLSGKLTGARKTAISRKAAKLVEFLNPENGFEFIPLTSAKRKAVKKNRDVAPIQLTPKGVFIPKPRSKRKTRVKISDKGEVETRTGKFISHFHTFDAAEVAARPEIIQEFADKIGAERAFISIKGHRGGSRKNGYSLKNFMRYMREDIIPDIEDAQGGELVEVNGKRRKSAFTNFVGVEFISYDWTYRKPKNKGRKNENRSSPSKARNTGSKRKRK
jgi:hypothetical protein